MAGHRRSLKILHIDPEKDWGGGEVQVAGLLGHLARWGHESHLCCASGGRLAEEVRTSGTRIFPLRMRNEVDLRPILPLRRLIRKEGYDIVHFHTKRAHALAAWLGRIRPGVRYVVTRRMDYPVRKNWYNRLLYNVGVDGVVAISEKIAALLAAGGVRKEKIRVIPSGVEPARFGAALRAGAGSGPPIVGTAAVLEERKGHRVLLEAAAQLKQQGLRPLYRLAGAGSQGESLRRLAAELDLSAEVAFLGFVPDIPAFLSTLDVFVLPSLHEGLGVAVLEAMAAGKPVVASRVGGIPELVEAQVTGLLVSPGDPRALAQAVGRLLSERDLAREMGAKGSERVRRHFTMERMAKRNEEFYYELLGLGEETHSIGLRDE